MLLELRLSQFVTDLVVVRACIGELPVREAEFQNLLAKLWKAVDDVVMNLCHLSNAVVVSSRARTPRCAFVLGTSIAALPGGEGVTWGDVTSARNVTFVSAMRWESAEAPNCLFLFNRLRNNTTLRSATVLSVTNEFRR